MISSKIPSDFIPFRLIKTRFLRWFLNFLQYDVVDILVIAAGVGVILMIWEFTFWR